MGMKVLLCVFPLWSQVHREENPSKDYFEHTQSLMHLCKILHCGLEKCTKFTRNVVGNMEHCYCGVRQHYSFV